MFVLSTIEADIKVQPKDLNKPPLTAVTEVVEELYLDKVVADLGLVVTIYDVLSIEGGHIYPNDGAAFFRCRFRIVVFRPFVGEILVGKLTSSTKEGLRISLGFFEDVIVPEYALQEPSFFSAAEGLWFWKYDDNEMFMELGEMVRVRVSGLRFNLKPTPASLTATTADGQPPLGSATRPFAPLHVLGDINGDGLGPISWWGAEPAALGEGDAMEA